MMKIKETKYTFTGTLAKRRATQKAILHHSASKSGNGAQIHQIHQKSNGWAGIGYHYVIHKDGTIERGRPEDMVGAHCINENGDSIGICFIGNFETEKMPPAQMEAGKELVGYIKDKYGLKSEDIYRHKDFMATACPGRNFPVKEIANGISSVSLAKKIKKAGNIALGSYSVGDIKLIKQGLYRLGYYSISTASKKWGKSFANAIVDFKKRNKLSSVSGTVFKSTARKMLIKLLKER